MTIEYENFRPNLVKNEVDHVVNDMTTLGEDRDPLPSLKNRSSKFRKFVLLRFLSKKIIQSQDMSMSGQDSEDEEGEIIGLPKINYIPFVWNTLNTELNPHLDKAEEGSTPLDAALIGHVQNRDKDFRKTVNSGRDSAGYHIGTLLNHLAYEYPDKKRQELIKILENSYGQSVAAFMSINQDIFANLQRMDNGLTVVKEYEGIGKIEVLNPELFSLEYIDKASKRLAIVPDWSKIGDLKIKLPVNPYSQLDKSVEAREFNTTDVTIGCPFHDYVKRFYPRLIEKIKLIE